MYSAKYFWKVHENDEKWPGIARLKFVFVDLLLQCVKQQSLLANLDEWYIMHKFEEEITFLSVVRTKRTSQNF